MEKIKFNLNDYISIKITQYGWKHLLKTVGADYIKNCIDIRKEVIDGQDYYRLQAHNVIELFGSAVFASFPAPLHPVCFIEIEATEDKKAPVPQTPHELAIIKNIWRRAYIDSEEDHVKILKEYGQQIASQERNRAIQEAIDLHTAMRWGTWHEIHDQLIKLSKLKK